ncbi:ABC transporter substrate-binding protein [Stackebrandtia nassauensis]|uniref:Probable sugar-binding periplasmic protein n=1 Tax=Stackebrandtia nassauensis (strain DSM 44728 / CIP 108903 / NRRL B-16338 / NBRC 102104 / LLR-40K-21) TaxID=446470 RepID=D3Q8Y4_STANL|nr:extracellular solute-binding protein [Stackebrandtia nassauensis]ADD40593.1 extracellular solute-binding protein family 1 [Stackebrandtia nassauensis DSM 44728]
MKRRGFVALAAAPALAPLLASCGGSESDAKKVEIFSWWSGPGEKEGLEKLIKMYEDDNSGVKVVNNGIAGGGGSKAKDQLATRLKNQDPPDSFQGHAGAELYDYIDNKVLEDITKFIKSEKLDGVLHPEIFKGVTVDGKTYSVPVNVHRANLMWYNPKVLEEAKLEPPKSWTELIEQNKKLKKDDKITLAVGPLWTQMQLMETVLLGELKAEAYTGLWDGNTDWASSEVIDALDLFTKVLEVTDLKSASDDWQPQLDKMMKGTAAYAVMGDWVYSYLTSSKKKEYDKDYKVVVTPGSEGVFDYLADSFTLPVGAPHKANAEAWLKICGSKEGQTVFNQTKGSLPARTDIEESEFTGYLAWNYKQWKDEKTTVVGSLAHGAVVRPTWMTEIETLLGSFVDDGDSKKFADKMMSTYEKTKK